MLWTDRRYFSAPVFFQHLQSYFEIYENRKSIVFFLAYLRYSETRKIKIVRVGAQGHVRKSRNPRNERSEGPHISKSKSYKFKLEENKTTEFLSISFPKKYYRNNPQIAKTIKWPGANVSNHEMVFTSPTRPSQKSKRTIRFRCSIGALQGLEIKSIGPWGPKKKVCKGKIKQRN